MFYVLLALRQPSAHAAFDAATQPGQARPAAHLVAPGHRGRCGQAGSNNRRWSAGASKAHPRKRCLLASPLFRRGGRKAPATTTFDFGFALGPRINAAGRLADMTLGIECLLTDNAGRAASWQACWTASTANAARSKAACASSGMLMAESLFDESEAPPAIRVRPRLSRRRGRHRSQPHQGQVAPPHLCVCRQQRARQRA